MSAGASASGEMLEDSSWFEPDWDRPPGVRALLTTRLGGVSAAPFHSFNLGASCGDDENAVQRNRARLKRVLPAAPRWLKQVHGTHVVAADQIGTPVKADASYTAVAGTVCVVLTADCLPVLLCDSRGTTVAAAHAGWRGLCQGVIESTVARFATPRSELRAYLGPAISARAYEVGQDVYDAFVARAPDDAPAFRPLSPGKYACDLCQLARFRLARAGVSRIEGGNFCTYSDPARFYSYRRDGRTGRSASLIWRTG